MRTAYFVNVLLGGFLVGLPACPDETSSKSDTSAPTDATVTPDATDTTDTQIGDTTECTLGTTDCACRSGGGCDAPLVCGTDNVCGPEGACVGSLACACDGTSCDAGLSCSDDVCTLANAVMLTLSGGDTRACDLVVTTTRDVADVVFPAGVRGHMWTRDHRTTIALMRSGDAALAGVVAAVVFTDDDAVVSSDVISVTTTCYDRRGLTASGVTVTH